MPRTRSTLQFDVHVCPTCGQPFVRKLGGRGRPREYDTPQCRDVPSRLADLYRALAWLVAEHGITNRAAMRHHSELVTLANMVNVRGGAREAPELFLRGYDGPIRNADGQPGPRFVATDAAVERANADLAAGADPADVLAELYRQTGS